MAHGQARLASSDDDRVETPNTTSVRHELSFASPSSAPAAELRAPLDKPAPRCAHRVACSPKAGFTERQGGRHRPKVRSEVRDRPA
jgi:hypothetical protein